MHMHIHKSRRHDTAFRVDSLDLMTRQFPEAFPLLQIFSDPQNSIFLRQNIADLPHSRSRINTQAILNIKHFHSFLPPACRFLFCVAALPPRQPGQLS